MNVGILNINKENWQYKMPIFKHLRYDDSFRRVNSIKNKLTPEDMENLYLDSNFEETFKNRKKELINYNQRFL